MKFKQNIASILNKLPYIKGLKRDLSLYEKWGIPGHFYNPIPDLEELIQYEYGNMVSSYQGIDLNIPAQLNWVTHCLTYYKTIPFPETKQKTFLYYFKNPNYSYADAIFYFFIVMDFKPKKIIEIGSGFSTCMAIDVNQHFFENKIDITAIEPYPQLLLQLCKEKAPNVLETKVQNINPAFFDALQENDILFIDSSHVLKAGSDVNHILFNILPRLQIGVLIHFHDIFNNFKYPKEWFTEFHRAWNEIYAIKLFLMYNDCFKIVAFNNFLINEHKEWFSHNMPLCLNNPGGSIWLKKVK